MNMYRDGAPHGSTSTSETCFSGSIDGWRVIFGPRQSAVSAGTFRGIVHEAFIWSRALSSLEVTQVYKHVRGVLFDVASHWDFTKPLLPASVTLTGNAQRVEGEGLKLTKFHFVGVGGCADADSRYAFVKLPERLTQAACAAACSRSAMLSADQYNTVRLPLAINSVSSVYPGSFAATLSIDEDGDS